MASKGVWISSVVQVKLTPSRKVHTNRMHGSVSFFSESFALAEAKEIDSSGIAGLVEQKHPGRAADTQRVSAA